MAMSQQKSASSSSRVGQYEDFQPKYEWKEEEEADLLLVHLPGFLRDHISTSYLFSTGTIRVIGQKPLGNNKWSRFTQDFPVPKNCIVEKIQGKLKNGILTLTLPKQTITKPPQPKLPPPPATTTGKPPRDSSISGEVKDVNNNYKTTKNNPLSPPQGTSPAKLISTSNVIADVDKKKSSSNTTTSDDKKVVDDPQRRLVNDLVPKVLQNRPASQVDDEKKELEGSAGLKMSENVKRKDDHDGKTTSMKIGGAELKKRTTGGDEMVEKKKDKKEDQAVAAAGKVKEGGGVSETVKRMKEFTMNLSEERQAMVNMGVAVLVIVALGAYISYTMGSTSENTD